MTDFVLSSGNIMKPYRSPWGAFPTKGMALSTGISSNVIRIGMVVGLDVNSTAYQNCIVPSSLSSGTIVSTAIVGIAAESPGAVNGNSGVGSTNSQGTVCMVWEANPNVEFRANTRGGLLNSTIVGQEKNLDYDSTLNIVLVNVGAGALATAQPRVVVTGLLDASGDSGGAVVCRFINSSASVLAFYH